MQSCSRRGLNVEVMDAEFSGDIENRLQLVDGSWKALPFGAHAAGLQERAQPPYEIAIAIVRADAGKSRPVDHFDILLERAFKSIGMAALHRP
jgi:hypothetical protein